MRIFLKAAAIVSLVGAAILGIKTLLGKLTEKEKHYL